MYNIVGSDLDGTLLTPEHKVAPFTRQVLKQLHDQGKHIVVATARHHINVIDIQNEIDIPTYIISSNGACIHNSLGDLLLKQELHHDVVVDIIEISKNIPELKIYIYSGDLCFVNHEPKNPDFDYQIFNINNPPVNDVIKIAFTCNDDSVDILETLQDKLNITLRHKVNMAFSTAWCLEVMNTGVSKGHALDIVAQELGYNLNNCIAFGDGMNDIEMLSMVAKGLVMSTAPENVKNALPNNDIIGSCAEESVAHYLNTHLLGK